MELKTALMQVDVAELARSRAPAEETRETMSGSADRTMDWLEHVLARHAFTREAGIETRAALAQSAASLTLTKGALVVQELAPIASIALIHFGTVRLHCAASGTRVVAYRSANEVLGEDGLASVSAHRYSAVAMTDLRIVDVPMNAVEAALSADQDLRRSALALFASRAMDAEARIQLAFSGRVEQRLAVFLLAAVARWGTPDAQGTLIDACLTHEEIASAIGSTRETTTGALNALRRQGVVAVRRRRIIVVDPNGLSDRAKRHEPSSHRVARAAPDGSNAELPIRAGHPTELT